MKIFSTSLIIGVAACTSIDSRGKSHEQLLAEVESIAVKCSPSGELKFKLVGTTLLHIKPSPSADFAEVDCFLDKVRPYHFDLGFIGNEALRPH